MTDRSHLSALPSPREQQVLRWLQASEIVDPRDLLERVAAETASMRQAQALPWDGVVDALRPEPFGRPKVRATALLVAAILIVAGLIVGTLLVGSRNDAPPIVAPPAPMVTEAPIASGPASAVPAPSAAIVSPLADPPLEIVLKTGEAWSVIRTDDGVARVVGGDLVANIYQPAWAPNGETFLVNEGTDATDQIWSVPVREQRRSLVMIPCSLPCGSRNEASYNHAGTEVVMFQLFHKGGEEICGLGRYDVESQEYAAITASACGIFEERFARFSPDDRSVAFWRSRSKDLVQFAPIEDTVLVVRDLATREERVLTDPDLHATALDWSPDGEWIVFATDEFPGGNPIGDLWRIRADGTGLERLTTIDRPETWIFRPRYSPDGRWILFQLTDGYNPRLMAIPAAGGADPIDVLPGMRVDDYDVRAADR